MQEAQTQVKPTAAEQSNKGVLPIVIGVIVGLILGAVIGIFVYKSGIIGGSAGHVAVNMAEGDLDKPIASYTYNGKNIQLTSREVFELNGTSIEVAKQEDGSYRAPAPEQIIAAMRDQILGKETEAQGIQVSDDEATEYVKSQLGFGSMDELAQYLGTDTENATKTAVRIASYDKLRQTIVPDSANLKMPEPPTEPEDGDRDAKTEAYGQYIVGLLGDNWDAENETWANTENDFYEAMKDSSFTSKSASYSDATFAYYVAYSQAASQYQSAAEKWRDYTNGLYEKVSNIQMSLLIAPLQGNNKLQ